MRRKSGRAVAVRRAAVLRWNGLCVVRPVRDAVLVGPVIDPLGRAGRHGISDDRCARHWRHGRRRRHWRGFRDGRNPHPSVEIPAVALQNVLAGCADTTTTPRLLRRARNRRDLASSPTCVSRWGHARRWTLASSCSRARPWRSIQSRGLDTGSLPVSNRSSSRPCPR
jgi:hypothetical protein